jgi:hypothetical protein
MIDAIAALANRFWSIHPNEIPLGITREQYYEREMRALFTTQATARIEQLEARLDRAVTRGLEQVERIATLEAALRVFADPLSWRRDGSCDPNSGRFEGQSIASTALASEQEK